MKNGTPPPIALGLACHAGIAGWVFFGALLGNLVGIACFWPTFLTLVRHPYAFFLMADRDPPPLPTALRAPVAITLWLFFFAWIIAALTIARDVMPEAVGRYALVACIVFTALVWPYMTGTVPSPAVVPEGDYSAEWTRLRRLHRRAGFVALAIVFGVLAFAWLGPGARRVVGPVTFSVGVLVAIAVLAWALIAIARFPCPRCGRSLFGHDAIQMLAKPRECPGCGLRIYSQAEPARDH